MVLEVRQVWRTCELRLATWEVSQVGKQGMWARRMGTARVNRARYINWRNRSYRYL